MQMKSFSVKTKDGVEHWCNRWMPDSEEEIKGIIQLHHGLAEHSLRYDRFGSILAENGYVLNAYDMRGHGKTAEIAEKNGTGLFGKLADKDGFNTVVEDLNEIIAGIKEEFPGKPVILLGHSFGSFVSQAYIERYSGNINGCILSGTSGPKGAIIFFGKILVNIICALRGKNAIVPALYKIAFGNYQNRIENPETENDWLTKDKFVVQMYNSDNWCGFPLTASFYRDMMKGLSIIHAKKNMKKIAKNLPVYFIYGSEDPVGDYGKSIEKLYSIYEGNGMTKLSKTVYKNDRHELLNETDKEKVEADIIKWVNETLSL